MSESKNVTKRTYITQQEISQAISMSGSATPEQISDYLNIEYKVVINALRDAGYCSKCGGG